MIAVKTRIYISPQEPRTASRLSIMSDGEMAIDTYVVYINTI